MISGIVSADDNSPIGIMYQIPYARFYRHGPCPHCGRHVRLKVPRCVHCSIDLSDEDRANVAAYAEAQHQKGIRVGIFVFSAVIVALVLTGLMAG